MCTNTLPCNKPDIFSTKVSESFYHWMKNQVSALQNLDGILLKLKVYVKFQQGFRCVNIKFPQSVNLSPLSFGMVSASGIIELTRLKLA